MGALGQQRKLAKATEPKPAPSAGTASAVAITTAIVAAVVPASTGGDYGDKAKAGGAGQNGRRIAAVDMVFQKVIWVDVAQVGRDAYSNRDIIGNTDCAAQRQGSQWPAQILRPTGNCLRSSNSRPTERIVIVTSLDEGEQQHTGKNGNQDAANAAERTVPWR